MAAVCGFTSVQQTVEVRQDRSPKMKSLLVVNICFMKYSSHYHGRDRIHIAVFRSLHFNGSFCSCGFCLPSGSKPTVSVFNEYILFSIPYLLNLSFFPFR